MFITLLLLCAATVCGVYAGLLLPAIWARWQRGLSPVDETVLPEDPVDPPAAVVESLPVEQPEPRWELRLGEDSVQRVLGDLPPTSVRKPHGNAPATVYRLLGTQGRIAYYEALV